MTKSQARGYIFEYIIWELLKSQGYINVKSGTVRGRGAFHQIDAYGTLSLPTPFIYPIRLIAEAKCYKNSRRIKLGDIRNFVGVIKDICENYTVDELNGEINCDRYADSGCFFSASPYTIDAQNYAWAQNIFIVCFSNIPEMTKIVKYISAFTDRLSTNELQKKKSFIEKFAVELKENPIRLPQLSVGVLNDNYPIILVGQNGWLDVLRDYVLNPGNELSEEYICEKTERQQGNNETLFTVNIKYRVQFVLPNAIAFKVIDVIDSSNRGDSIFKIDIPLLISRQGKQIRRIITLDVRLPGREQKKIYIKKILDSNIASVIYNEERKTLEMEFHAGGIYKYLNVPKSVYEGLMSAGSKGQYFHQNIKDVYQYQKVG